MAGKCLIFSMMAAAVLADGTQPAFKTDPNTTKYCSFWFDSDGTATCQDVVDNYVSSSMVNFLRWVSRFTSLLIPPNRIY